MSYTTTPATIALLSDHGRYLCVEIDGRVVADRPDPNLWEQFDVEPRDGGKISIRSHLGKYLTAELDGQVTCRTAIVGEWEEWTPFIVGGRLALLSHHGTFLTAELDYSLRCRATEANVWEQWRCELGWLQPVPTVTRTNRPLEGPLRVQDKLLRDDTGYRRVFFCSWFPALRILRDNPAEFERQIDVIAAAGYQGFRTFLAVGGWTDFWDGREVAPVTFQKWFFTGNHLRTDRLGATIDAWPDYDDLLRTLLRACRARGLRLHVTTGDMQAICPDANREIELHRRFARICAEEGGLEVIALAECTNEYPLNRYGGEGPQSIEQMGRVLQVWREAIPGVLTAQGAAPQREEPEELHKAATHGEVCITHTTRSPFAMSLKRTLGLVYWEGNYRAFPKPFWQGEPAGPGADSYQRLDDPASLTALYAMHALTGQGSVQFSGPAVRSREPLESVWGFRELPLLLAAHLPEDIATWDRSTAGRGAILYWSQGHRFATSMFKDWDPTPPRPVREWSIYSGPRVTHGQGTPARLTGLLVGSFQ